MCPPHVHLQGNDTNWPARMIHSCCCSAGLSAGKGYVDVSTIDPATAADVAAAVRATGALYLEAPVSGSKGPAEQGALIFLTAGVQRG
jgi:3-hydroxyisobutyrate dehydrogenase-like beta-hydroxyacid dehydrogenase